MDHRVGGQASFVSPSRRSRRRIFSSAARHACSNRQVLRHEPISPARKEPGAYVRTILESLAFKYRLVLRNLEQVTGKHVEQIRIIGGGSKNRLLNQLTADATGRRVLAGPAEATALGNIAVQILATGGATSLQEVRAIVDRSFPNRNFRADRN